MSHTRPQRVVPGEQEQSMPHTDIKPAQLSTQLRAAAQEAGRKEARIRALELTANHMLDMHNDLMEWATSTTHDEAAAEVLAILEMHVKTKESRVTPPQS